MPTFLFAGGGSGGHIFPGLAVAERLSELSPDADPVFACSTRAIDERILAAADVEYRPLPAAPVSVRPRAGARFLAGFARSRRLTRRLIDERRITAVLALGGFVAAPAVAAARAEGVPTLLLNLDAHPGKANRWLARRCDAVATAVPLPDHPRFARQIVGMPVRRQAIARDTPAACRTALGLDPERPTLLVVGGSQGAASLNGFATAMAAARPETLAGWQVLHVAGPAAGEIGAAYDAAGVRASVVEFIDEVGLAWGAADLALSRAGAGSVAEAAINGVPTVFLPYPFHRDDHQRLNARPLERLGGAIVVEDRVDPAVNVREAGPRLIEVLEDDTRRAEMTRRLREQRPADAAETVARRLIDMAN